MSRSFAERPAAALIAALLAAAPGPVALAQGLEKWGPHGLPLATSYGERVFPVAVPDGAGGALVVWQELGMIRMQRVNADGATCPGWNASAGIKVCDMPNRGGWMQSSPRAISDGAGGAYVLWMDQRNKPCDRGCIGDPRQIFLQRITANGRIADGWPAVGVDAGSALGTMNPQPAGLRGYAIEMNPVLVPDGQGGALIAWTEATFPYGALAPIPGVHVQRISPAGERRWGERGVLVSPTQPLNTTAPPVARVAYPAIVADGEGGAFVAWQDERAGEGTQIYTQHVSADGQPLLAAEGERFSDESGDANGYPQIVALEKGGALVVWQSGPRTGAVSLWAKVLGGERGRAYQAVLVSEFAKADGNPTSLPESEIALIADAKQGAWVSWIDVRDAAHPSIHLQHLRKDGGPAGGWPEGGVAICDGSIAQCSRPALVDDGLHGVYVGWRDGTGPRMTRVNHDGDFARGWPQGGLALANLGYDRGFHMIPDQASGAIVVWDQWMSQMGVIDVRGQRVGPAGSSIRGYARRSDSGEASTPSLAPRFALTGFEPNPAAGPLAIAFSLAASGPASLEVFDLTGRRVLHREVGSLGAGRHRVALAAAALRPGVYQIRLTQAGQRLTMRGVVTR